LEGCRVHVFEATLAPSAWQCGYPYSELRLAGVFNGRSSGSYTELVRAASRLTRRIR
jgi:hypothetical protein